MFYREVQRLRNSLLVLLILLPAAIAGTFVILESWLSGRLSTWAFIPPILLLGGTNLVLMFGRLITEVREDGIHLRYFPFHREYRRFLFNDIISFETKQVSPLGDHLGWGIRSYGLNGKAYTVYGRLGLELHLKDGRRIFIGTQASESLRQAVESAAR